MFGSTILEVAIGLVLVYLLLSLICSALQELLEGWFKVRATHLEQGLRVLLNDPKGTQLLQSLYNHPFIYGLFRGDYDPNKLRNRFQQAVLPSYIPAASFATALIDTLVRGPVSNDPEKKTLSPVGELTWDSLRASIINSPILTESIQRVLLLSLDSANGDLAKAQANIEAWFNAGMERVSGWYKRRTQVVLLGLGFAIAVALNVDTLKVAQELYQNDAVRAGALAQAGAVVKDGTMNAELSKSAADKLGKLNLPIGWQAYESKPDFSKDGFQELFKVIYTSIFGWLFTAIAISFGAPFWFDLLNRLMNIRSSVRPGEKSPATPPSKDQQPPAQPGQVAAPGIAAQAVADEENGADSCDIPVKDITADEDLPAAEGGVANHA